MLKLDEKESLDPKMSDFEWLSEAFNFSMFNMLDLDLSLFAYFWSYYLSNFDVWPLILKLRTCSTRILPLLPKNGKTCPKIADIGNFQTHFAVLRYFGVHLVAILAQILVEQVLSFTMSTQTSKLDKN